MFFAPLFFSEYTFGSKASDDSLFFVAGKGNIQIYPSESRPQSEV
jgi:hypothetical protein